VGFAAQLISPTAVLPHAAVADPDLVGGVAALSSAVHAFLAGSRVSPAGSSIGCILAVLAVLIVVSHLGAGYYMLAYSDAPAHRRSTEQPRPDRPAEPRSGETAQPSQSLPPPVEGGRGDRPVHRCGLSSRRGETLYDSIMVVSFDPKTNSVQMISVPRDSASFPF